MALVWRGTREELMRRLARLALHESGHAVDDGSFGVVFSRDQEFKDIHAEVFGKLPPYLQQDGPGGLAGCEELFAEGFAAILMDERGARGQYGDRFVDYMKQKVLS